VSGSDQYGTPIALAAEAGGEDVAAFARRQHEDIARVFTRVGISFDHYGETAVPAHAAVVSELFGALDRGGFIDEADAPAAWCTAEGRSIPDRYVEGGCPRCGAAGARGDQCPTCGGLLDPADLLDPRCRRCGAPAELKLLRQLFIALDRLQPRIRGSATRSFAQEETRAALRAGLRARAITRDLDWGVPVPRPGWDDRRLYVWFDAVIGYLSASIAARPDGWREWWCGDTVAGTRHRYFVGKDNVWFHTLWWPAILAGTGAGYRQPDEVVASHHLRAEGAQFSSSRGHGTTIDDALDRVGVDPLRHALLALAPETADVDFTWTAADDLTRTGLLGAIANPAHRVATLIWQRFPGVQLGGDPAEAIGALARVDRALDRSEFRRALAEVHGIGRHINQVLARTEPWRSGDDDAKDVLASLGPWVSALSVAAWPFVPATASAIRCAFGWSADPVAWAVDAAGGRVDARPVPPMVLRPNRT
jgi:methionyl-tRNA synthetase